MQPTVDIKTVLSQLMDRLSNYAASSTEVSFVHLCHKLSSHLFVDIIYASGITRIFASGSIYQTKHCNKQGKLHFFEFETFTYTCSVRTKEKDLPIKLQTINYEGTNVVILSNGFPPSRLMFCSSSFKPKRIHIMLPLEFLKHGFLYYYFLFSFKIFLNLYA